MFSSDAAQVKGASKEEIEAGANASMNFGDKIRKLIVENELSFSVALTALLMNVSIAVNFIQATEGPERADALIGLITKSLQTSKEITNG